VRLCFEAVLDPLTIPDFEAGEYGLVVRFAGGEHVVNDTSQLMCGCGDGFGRS